MCTVVSAQESTPESELNIFTKIVPPSPDAGKLASYVEAPVSYFTGQPVIEIPIYELKGKEISLPIKLSYKSGGIKVEEISSGVGLGWSLIAGGVMTRTVFGLPDEGDIGSFTKPFFDNYQRILANKNGLPTSCTAPNTISDYRAFQDDVMKYKTVDTQPDIYFYNFNGITGKLFLDEQGIPRTIPFKNYTITPGVGPIAGAGWTVITDSGDKYFFNKLETTRTTVEAGVSEYDKAKNYPSSWYLTQIISKNGFDSFTFEYDETAEIRVRTNSGLNEYRTDVNGYGDPLCVALESQGYSPGPVTYVRQVFLKKISDNHGRVIEINNVQDRQDYLGAFRHSSIVVKEDSRVLLTATLINNQYFGTGSETAKRLKLERVEITGTDQLDPEVFSFQYNAANLPDRMSFNQDLWGYYKQTGSTTTMIPAMPGLPGGVDRSPDESQTKACGLERVYFPTGGYQKFTFEQNSTGPLTPLGGLRVKEINWYDDNSAMIKKVVYRYTGIEVGQAVYSTGNTRIGLNCGNPVPPTCYLVTRFAANRSQVGASAGYHVGYETVEEETRDFLDASGNGKTVYRFNVPNIASPYPYSPPAFQGAVSLGLLLTKTVYNANGIPLRSEESCYQGIVSDNPSTESLIPSTNYAGITKKSLTVIQLASELTTYSKPLQWKQQGCTFIYDHPCLSGGDGFNPFPTGYVPLKPYQFGYTSSFAYYPTGKVIREYSNGNELVSVEKYSYGNTTYNFITSKESSTSRLNESLITDITYPFNLSGQPYSTMVTRNMLTQVVEKRMSRKVGTIITPIGGEKYTFIVNGNSVLPTTYAVAGDGTSYRDEIMNIEYDIYGNVRRLTEKGIEKAFIWDDLYLQAEAVGTPGLRYQGFEGSTTNFSMDAKAGAKSSSVSYTALPPWAGTFVLSYWKKVGNGSWEYFQDMISSNTVIGGGANTLIDEVRIAPAGTKITSYSHEKGVGIIAVNDLNNRVTYYKYDGKRRLRLILDDEKKILKRYEYHYRTGPVPTN